MPLPRAELPSGPLSDRLADDDAGHRVDALEHASIERLQLVGVVARAAQIEARDQHALAVVADVGAGERPQAAHEQAGDDQEQQTEGDLRGDEQLAER